MAYRANGAIYLIPRDILLERQTFDLEPILGYVMDVEHSIDIDCEWDLYLADLVLHDRASHRAV
jgi:CMP-N-acetylneuraminic acid synthetase